MLFTLMGGLRGKNKPCKEHFLLTGRMDVLGLDAGSQVGSPAGKAILVAKSLKSDRSSSIKTLNSLKETFCFRSEQMICPL